MTQDTHNTSIDIPQVEACQDEVEHALFDSGFSEVAKVYALYCDAHPYAREMRVDELVNVLVALKQYVDPEDLSDEQEFHK